MPTSLDAISPLLAAAGQSLQKEVSALAAQSRARESAIAGALAQTVGGNPFAASAAPGGSDMIPVVLSKRPLSGAQITALAFLAMAEATKDQKWELSALLAYVREHANPAAAHQIAKAIGQVTAGLGSLQAVRPTMEQTLQDIKKAMTSHNQSTSGMIR